MDFFDSVYFNNSVRDYSIVVGIIAVSILLISIFKRTILKRLKRAAEKTSTKIDDFIVATLDEFGIPALYVTIGYFAIHSLTLSEKGAYVLNIAVTLAITYLVIRFVSTVVILLLKYHVGRQAQGEDKIKQIGGIILIINIAIWLIGLLFFFANMGYDVTAIIAGLGIGGIAIALAAQNILGDLFNYFVIFFDRPFEVGDFLVIDDKMGTVENIGIKTTRLKSISGERLVFANSDLTASRIHNFKHLQRRRVVFKIGINYQTSYDLLKEIPQLLKQIIEQQEPVEFDRAHFASYGDSSLDFEVVYFVLDPDYNKYMDIQQAINFEIYDQFEKRGIEIAYPTRTVFLVNEEQGNKPAG